MTRPLRVFLCHSSNDKPAVRELYQKLRAETWIELWLDEEELYPGEDWEIAIEKAVENSDVVLVCLSNGSINKRGFVQKELRFALDVALEMPEETVFIIPLRLEECTPPRNLKGWHYADYFEGQRERGLQRLLVSLKRRADSLGLKSESVEKDEKKKSPKPKQRPTIETPTTNITLSNGMELMRVPAGKFIMGSDTITDNEKPQHSVEIHYDYWMARFTITNEQYNEYCKAENVEHPVSDWEKKKNHPVTNVSWLNAMGYCKWLNSLLKNELPNNLILRLPTEAEWEKAARGTDGREYPWGNQEPDKNLANYSRGIFRNVTTSVGAYSPQGDSHYGCADMAGNVWEWTHSLYKGYPYNAKDGREDEKSNHSRVQRGGAIYNVRSSVRCAHRHEFNPSYRYYIVGFRLCVSSPIGS